jgi:hypothetical protein
VREKLANKIGETDEYYLLPLKLGNFTRLELIIYQYYIFYKISGFKRRLSLRVSLKARRDYDVYYHIPDRLRDKIVKPDKVLCVKKGKEVRARKEPSYVLRSRKRVIDFRRF